MASLDIKDEIAYPLDTVYPAFRDDLKEVAPYLPNIADIIVQSVDRVDDNTVKVVNLWKASDGDIPKMAQGFIKPDMLQWTDRATWHDDKLFCEWDMEVGFLPEAVSCKGKTPYTQRGDRTEVHITGELVVNAKKIPGVPRLMAGKIGPMVESFVVKMIAPNLKATNRAMEKHLAAVQEG
mgnify:CR=1 FL=1